MAAERTAPGVGTRSREKVRRVHGAGGATRIRFGEEAHVMQRHRCTKCRNPIRGVGVPRPGTTCTEWYHPDCWVDVRASEQESYEEQVRSDGLSALLAPYFNTGPAHAAE